jgi:hypothetical protein
MTLLFLPPPRTLRAVGLYVADGAAPYPSMMKEFVDGLIRDLQDRGALASDRPLPVDPVMIADEPPVLNELVFNVHLAAMAEYLAELGGIVPPVWAAAPDRFLAAPMGRGVSDTPDAFARRGLYCGPALKKMWSLLGSPSDLAIRRR